MVLSDVPVDSDNPVDIGFVSARTQNGTNQEATASVPGSWFSADHAAYSGAGEYIVAVTATDAHGNTGTHSQTFVLP